MSVKGLATGRLLSALLRVTRILIVQNTRWAMAGGDDSWMRQRVARASGADLIGFHIGAEPKQTSRLRTDVDMVRAHPLIAGRAQVGGSLCSVDTGLLDQRV